MKIHYIISIIMLSSLLFSENIDEQLINDSPLDISLTDTSDLDSKLKLFLDKYYQKNFVDDKYLKSIKSMQLVGTYKVNGKEIGTIKIIKKRPNKYKSIIKKYDGTQSIIIFDGKNLKSKKAKGKDPTAQWQSLDLYDSENIWIHYEQIFDSIMLNPKDPNKTISIGKTFIEDGKVVQEVTIELKNKIKATNYIPSRDNLILKTLIEFNKKGQPNYNFYTIYYKNYESVNDIMFAKNIITHLREDFIIEINFTGIDFNLGISDFFFKALSF